MALGYAIRQTVHLKKNNDKIMTTKYFGRYLKFV